MPRFRHSDFSFCIEDPWWSKAGMAEFRPTAPQYRVDPSDFDGWQLLSVGVGEVEPLYRRKLNHGNGFFASEEQVVQILRGFIENSAIPPVEVVKQPAGSDYLYKLHHGAHRFYCSVAAGFSHVPTVEVEPSPLFHEPTPVSTALKLARTPRKTTEWVSDVFGPWNKVDQCPVLGP